MSQLQELIACLSSACSDAQHFENMFGATHLSQIAETIRKTIRQISEVNCPKPSQPHVCQAAPGESCSLGHSFCNKKPPGSKDVKDEIFGDSSNSVQLMSFQEPIKINTAKIAPLCEDLLINIQKMTQQFGKTSSESPPSQNQLSEPIQPIQLIQNQQMKNILGKLRISINNFMMLYSESKKTTESISELEEYKEECGLYGEKSSKRSLLTEKMKLLEPEKLGENNEDDVEDIRDHQIVKNSLIINEIKKHSKGNMTEPLRATSTFSGVIGVISKQNCNVNEVQSVQVAKAPSRRRQQSRRLMLGAMKLQKSSAKERKQKKEEEGCARCDIY